MEKLWIIIKGNQLDKHLFILIVRHKNVSIKQKVSHDDNFVIAGYIEGCCEPTFWSRFHYCHDIMNNDKFKKKIQWN